MRAATIPDGEVVVAGAPRSRSPGPARSSSACAPRGSTAPTCSSARARYPAPPGSPPDIPGLELAGEVAALGPGAAALRRGRPRDGDRRRRRPGRAGRRPRAPAHAGARTRSTGPQAGGLPEVFTTAHDAIFTQGGLRAGRAAARPRRGRRRRHRRRPARRARPARTSPRPCATRELRDAVARARRRTTVLDPEGFAEHGPFDVVLELVGAPNLAGNLDALATGGRIVVIGVGAGAKAELNLLRADGQARDASAPRRCARARSRRRRSTARAMERTSCRCSTAARCASRSPRRSRSTTSPPPTSASPRAASSARSSLLTMNAVERLWRALRAARLDTARRPAARARAHRVAAHRRALDAPTSTSCASALRRASADVRRDQRAVDDERVAVHATSRRPARRRVLRPAARAASPRGVEIWRVA